MMMRKYLAILLLFPNAALAELPDVSNAITEELPLRESTFTTDRCGGLFMALRVAEKSGAVVLEPWVELATRDFLESSIAGSDRGQQAVVDEMTDYAQAYMEEFERDQAFSDILKRDGQYCEELAEDFGHAP